MIAIYARQSVDRADSISVESQLDFCAYEARGEEYRQYIDRGYSGKNTARPAFKEMVEAIEQGEVNKVIVYKLDRISRSILDFSSMMELFNKYHVAFVSATEKFDTDSPMGRAMLNICIVFAQLERETIQKRVADAYYARSQKSFYMGGRVPYGFRLEKTVIDGIRTSKYVIHPEEAEHVKLIYELYAKPDTSYGDLVTYFADHGILKDGKPWGRSRMADILRNPIYVRADLDVYEFYKGQGVLIANPEEDFIGVNGCYYYKGQDATGRKHTTLAGNHLVLAPHEGIIPADLWLKCRAKCLNNRQIGTNQKAKNTWLAGKIKCAKCGYALVDKHYADRDARYLLCSHRMNSKACEGAGTIYSKDFEELVFGEMKKKLAEYQSISKEKRPTANPEQTTLQIQLYKIEDEISALMGKLTDADDTLFRYINEKIKELDTQKQEIAARLSSVKEKKEADIGAITNHIKAWDTLSFEHRRETVDLLISVIHASSDKLSIDWRF